MSHQILVSWVVLVIGMLAFSNALAELDPHAVQGTFLNGEETAHIQIESCGEQSLCGKIVWLDPAKLEPGVTPESARSKSGDPVIGLTILKDFERRKKDWRGGTIYDPGKDKLYASRLKRLEDGSLQVKGCIAFICQTQIWTAVVP